MHRGQPRLEYLDGLRGVAITLVLFWHYLGPTYAPLLPFGDRYGFIPPWRNGWTGVQLFFMISGFVIFMTIERCSGWRDFMLRRWLRLFPAMLIATVVLFAIDRFAHLPGPSSDARWRDLLPGLLFLPPAIFHAVTRLDFQSLDPVFWTLYTEVGFYVIFGAMFFWLGWLRSVIGLVVMWAGTVLITTLIEGLHPPAVFHHILDPLGWVGSVNFGWFASGALFYKAWSEQSSRIYWSAVIVGLGSAFTSSLNYSLYDKTTLVLIVAAFALVQKLGFLQQWLSNRLLVGIGFISYPLYLTHSNLGVGLIWLFARWGLSPAVLAVIPATVCAVVLAWLIARYGEPPLRRRLRPFVDRLRGAAEGREPSQPRTATDDAASVPLPKQTAS